MEKIMEKIIQGDCLEVLKTLPDNSVDAVVTDPPYGLSKEPDTYEVLTKWMNGEDYHHRSDGFMGKSWDSFVPGPSVWREVYRVLKPGGHLLCFAGTRTQDLMTISLRLAGFEVRDVIEWLYFSGFPKNHDVSKAFDKRAGAEREVIGKKIYADGKGRTSGKIMSLSGKNLRPYQMQEGDWKEFLETAPATELAKKWDGWGTALKPAHEPIILARKKLDGTICDNVEKWGCGALNIDGCRIGHDTIKTNGRGNMSGATPIVPQSPDFKGETHIGRFPANCITLEEDAFFSKYFNISPPDLSKKASKKDRNSDWKGNEINLPPKQGGSLKGTFDKSLKTGSGKERKAFYKNNHPTVKPVPLMEWLVRLITPPNGIVLDPFAGSGSTLVAAKREGLNYIGIEKEAEYVEIAKLRVGQR